MAYSKIAVIDSAGNLLLCFLHMSTFRLVALWVLILTLKFFLSFKTHALATRPILEQFPPQ